MKIKPTFSLGLISLLIASTAYATDKYPLDPAYAANKQVMESAKKYEAANISPSTPSSGGDQWKLIYSGNPVSSVNIPSGTKFVSVEYGYGQKVLAISPSTPHGEIDAGYITGETGCNTGGHGETWGCSDGAVKKVNIKWDGKSIKSYYGAGNLEYPFLKIVYVM